jgi:predicted NodU family carbamoyl transferase
LAAPLHLNNTGNSLEPFGLSFSLYYSLFTLLAITHVNGSARGQTVSARDNSEFHTLFEEGKLTGREMMLNTSFNVKGQPIVNTPREAIDTFFGIGIRVFIPGEHPAAPRRPEIGTRWFLRKNLFLLDIVKRND